LANGSDISRRSRSVLGHGRILGMGWVSVGPRTDRAMAAGLGMFFILPTLELYHEGETRLGCSTCRHLQRRLGSTRRARFFTVARCSKSWLAKLFYIPAGDFVSQLVTLWLEKRGGKRLKRGSVEVER